MVEDQSKNKPMTVENVVTLVTAPVLSQVNLIGANLLKRLNELQEIVEMIGRQIQREIPKSNDADDDGGNK